MNKTKLPTLKAIMSERGCSIDEARSIRARMEVEADRDYRRKIGKHLLPVVSARDLERHPELAVQDIVRPKLTEWKVDDRLKTAEDRAAYILATVEEGTSDALPDAFADVFRSIGKTEEAMACEALAAYLRSVEAGRKPLARQAARRARPAKRELARA